MKATIDGREYDLTLTRIYGELGCEVKFSPAVVKPGEEKRSYQAGRGMDGRWSTIALGPYPSPDARYDMGAEMVVAALAFLATGPAVVVPAPRKVTPAAHSRYRRPSYTPRYESQADADSRGDIEEHTGEYSR
jgi:hypothetical protein